MSYQQLSGKSTLSQSNSLFFQQPKASSFSNSLFEDFFASQNKSASSSGLVSGPVSGNQSGVFFTPVNKISLVSLERRIDYHLGRIMKQNRLVNFKNSIGGLSIQDRIHESLLEIIASSNSLVARRQTLIETGYAFLGELNAHLAVGDVQGAYQTLVGSIVGTPGGPSLKTLSSSLGQLIWALNSNKEHIKYVAKVCALPDAYGPRFGGFGGFFGKEDGYVPLKKRISEMVATAEEAIGRAQELKGHFHEVIISTFLSVCGGGPEDGGQGGEEFTEEGDDILDLSDITLSGSLADVDLSSSSLEAAFTF